MARRQNSRSWIAGPATPEGRARALQNLAAENSVTHGVNRWLQTGMAPPCYRCRAREECPLRDSRDDGLCAIAIERQEELIAGIMGLPHVEGTDYAIAREFAKQTVAMEIADLWLSRMGPWVETEGGDIEVRPLMNLRLQIARSQKDLAKELGLTPASRVRMRADETPIAERIARVFADSKKAAEEGEES